MLDFECKCGACRRTCCRHDWNVTLSRDEYARTTSNELSPALRELARKHIKPNPCSTFDGDYAYVEMYGDVNCPMLDENGLCTWICESGECPCSTCANFPRTCLRYFDDEYLMPSTGCEAVVEALLRRDAPIALTSRHIESPTRNYFVHITEDLAERRPLLGLYPQLIAFGLSILQNRTVSLDERMACLLERLAALDAIENSKRTDLLPDFLARTPSLPSRASRAKSSQEQPPAWPAVFVGGEIFRHYCDTTSHGYTSREILEGIGVEPRLRINDKGTRDVTVSLKSTEAYSRAKAKLASFFERKSVFLEHVAVCLFLKTLTPIREPNVWTHATYFAAVYAAMKAGLTGLFAQSEPSDEQLADAVVEITRMAVHADLMYRSIYIAMAKAQLTTLPGTQAIVRA